ncbi:MULTISPECIES: triose-phosphate isomerase [Dietzia]|uniref:Triosephosphate isomerase n=1 Tax=Dietzia cinnamea TaxID=321318 RepID=A0A4R3ZYM5_9ACTN|nr:MULTISPECIES: triose-phosphate isomerase [Dietzia]KZO60324.1 triose-phosphate isomerase [Dietzia maris]AVM65330.1 triose-phosphate isomerase [Dietzia sp. oral taxon 368]MCT1887026.1 triose-phosphate isomerase [Dietzia cinnamea]MCT2060131.1 triose-phosphate isomerase [Dietzia cinnamea]MCT2100152.1 triose-phosphate isomerase [Dietzia cinnamea]
MSRTPLIAGNWKMNLNHLEAIALVQKVAFSLPEKYLEKVDVAFLPPFTNIRGVQIVIEGDKLGFAYGAQDVSVHESGAYTGEISASMLAKLGCTYVVVGHSERRDYHAETDELVAAKAAAGHRHGLTPIVCVGEKLEVREAGDHVDFVVNQLKGSLEGLTTAQLASTVIAYEPVWAIGTGKTASAADAQEVCAAIRSALAELADAETAESMRVLYGGSVNASNVGELLEQSDVDGGLVGGASLKPDEFAQLCAIAAGGPLP